MNKVMKIVILVLVALNLTVPFFVLKFTYFDAMAKRKLCEKQLQEIRKKNASISALLNKPDAVIKLQNELTEEIAVLQELMPPKTEMIAAQKFLSQFAREANVIIVALRPIEDSVPLVLNMPGDDQTEEIKEGEQSSTEVQLARVELKVKGTYADICKYVSTIEKCDEVKMIVHQLTISQFVDDAGPHIESDIGVKIYYSV